MDHAKTTFPRLQICNKRIFELGQLHVIFMGMIVHEHEDEKYAQYSNELWLNEPYFTIVSLLQLLRMLEVVTVLKSKLLFEDPPHNSFFARLLQGKSHCVRKLWTSDQTIGVKPLAKKLLFQMDDFVEDNENRHLLAFLSLLTTKDVFEEVKLVFLVVGHTHEDIDGCFGYLSKKLREENNYILMDLMRAFMISQERSFIP